MARKSLLQRLIRGFSMIAILAMLGMLLLACGDEEDVTDGNTGSNGGAPTAQPIASPTTPPASPTTNPGSIDHPSGPDDVIIRIDYAGGFVMQQALLTRLPVFVLFGNGCYVVQGPVIAIYPPPAMPNLQETCLNEEGVQAILAKAKEAGLLDGDAEYDNNMIADAVTTVFTVTANGQTSTVRAYALGGEFPPSAEMPEAEQDAREQLAAFMQDMAGVESWIEPGMIVEQAHEYAIERLQIFVLPADSASAPPAEEGIEPQTLEWPLETGLADFGAPYLGGEFSCGIVEGADLATLMPLLTEANQLTRWVSGDTATPDATAADEYILFLRPLFPNEEPCTEPVS